jgi:hypothetical protein
MPTGVAHCCHHGWIIQLQKRLKGGSNPLQIQASRLPLLLPALLLLLVVLLGAAGCCLSFSSLPRLLQVASDSAACRRRLLHGGDIHWLHASCVCLRCRAARLHWLLLLHRRRRVLLLLR